MNNKEKLQLSKTVGHNPGSVGAFFEPKKVAPQTHTPGSVGAFFEPKK